MFFRVLILSSLSVVLLAIGAAFFQNHISLWIDDDLEFVDDWVRVFEQWTGVDILERIEEPYEETWVDHVALNVDR